MSARKQVLLILVLLSCSVLSAQHPVPVRPAITGLSHVTFYADNLHKSENFYVHVLGWEELPSAGASSGIRFYANPAQYIELIPASRPGRIDRLQSFGFNTSNAEMLRRFLRAHGLPVPPAVTLGQDGSRSFVVHDPEGNEVEFTQPGRHPLPAPADLSRRLSTHIIHAGFVAHDRAALDRFYRDILGFHLYWQGWAKPGHIDWVMMQVPNGTDWIEYMLYLPVNPTRAQLGSANHFSPGVVSIADLHRRLLARGEERPPLLALDGKWQLDLVDPDGTRVEFMEFRPVKSPCCSPFTGPFPGPYQGW
jgi:catechol 2,3-dioxygenase-like lactoylglutathione lyase family enzyme